MKMKLLCGALVLVLTCLIALPTPELAAQQDGRTWSIAIHFAYKDGSQYDYVIARGVPTRDVSSYLSECGASHWTGSVVRYHCYPIPE